MDKTGCYELLVWEFVKRTTRFAIGRNIKIKEIPIDTREQSIKFMDSKSFAWCCDYLDMDVSCLKKRVEKYNKKNKYTK